MDGKVPFSPRHEGFFRIDVERCQNGYLVTGINKLRAEANFGDPPAVATSVTELRDTMLAFAWAEIMRITVAVADAGDDEAFDDANRQLTDLVQAAADRLSPHRRITDESKEWTLPYDLLVQVMQLPTREDIVNLISEITGIDKPMPAPPKGDA